MAGRRVINVGGPTEVKLRKPKFPKKKKPTLDPLNPEAPHTSAPRLESLPFEATLAYAFRGAGGKATAIEAARLVQHEDIRFQRLVTAYDSQTESDRLHCRLETLCEAAEILPDEFLSIVIPALWKRGVDIGKLIAAVNHPRVVEATAEAAMGKFGMPDRKMLLDAAGFLPIPKGQQINIDLSHKTLNSGNQREVSGVGLPSFEVDGIDGVHAIRGDASSTRAQLTQAPERLPILDAETEDINVPSSNNSVPDR